MKLVKINNRRLNLYFTHKELLDEKINIDKMLIDEQVCNTYINDIISILNNEIHLSLEKERLIFQIFPLVEGDLLVSVTKKDEPTDEFVYKFEDIEEIFFVFDNFFASFSGFSSIFTYNKNYYLVLCECSDEEKKILWILKEFGTKSLLNKGFLDIYGKCLMRDNAVETTFKYFLRG